ALFGRAGNTGSTLSPGQGNSAGKRFLHMAIDDLESLDADIRLPADARREPEVNKLFRAVMKHEGSDLHLKAGLPPMMRHKGVIKKMDLPALSQENIEKLLTPIINQKHMNVFEETGGCDFAHVIGSDECR